MIAALLGAMLVVVAVPDPGTSARGASVDVSSIGDHSPSGGSGTIGPDGRATFSLVPRTYRVAITKPGFVPARAIADVRASGTTVRIPLHAVQSSALRTIGAVGAAERGAFNRAPEPLQILAREGYRDQGQPGTSSVLTQTPSITVDRAGRGLARADEPPVALVRGGTPLETQILLEGVPVALPTTRTIPLSAIPAFVTQEVEVHPGEAATLPETAGALNGSVNIRFAEPTPVWRALPEVGADSRGGSFADISAGGASADRRIGVALAATSNGTIATTHPFDTIQRALLLKARASLSPAATFTATGYSESDANRFDASGFGFSEADLRVSGARDTVLARWWHVAAFRSGPAAGDPFELRTDDSLTGASLEVDRSLGQDLFSLGASETYGLGSADGATYVGAGAFERVQMAFARAIVHPAKKLETQLALYSFRTDLRANGAGEVLGGAAARLGLAYTASPRTTIRASVGDTVTPPSLIAFAGRAGPLGPSGGGTIDLGVEQRVIDARTTLSADVFTTNQINRAVETRDGRWIDAGSAARHGLEISLARRAPSGLGYLLQAWTASETPTLLNTGGDVASGTTHGYAEISYHGVQGSRVSLGATYWGADPSLAQPATVLLNTNVEIQVGARGKIQFSIENLNDAARAVTSPRVPFLETASPFAPGPRTVRLLLRRSFGRTGTDG
ncbi:MAG TPA: TonB-dependent receptor [Candidatus Elarobacter sp.]|nr:TonB-dependent receptor [Candidatus Elarobacter sp.]